MGIMEGCRYCDNLTDCLVCYFGKSVDGGCTDVIGCVEVAQADNAGMPSSLCVACDTADYLGKPVKGKCVCNNDSHLAGAYCISTPGCVTAREVAGVVVCIACDPLQNFNFSGVNGTCLCADGYSLIESVCTKGCGDGIVTNEDCDDGNNIDGDGCSANCTLEVHYRCPLNSQGTSACQYVGSLLSIVLMETQKDP
jgi:cysteine-rich repeat protein